MKTIRQNVFETNSSSTHSVTIYKKKVDTDENYKPLVEDNIIFPSRLNQFSKLCGSYNNICELVCDTKDKKCALLIHWITFFVENEDISDSEAKRYINYVISQCGYSDIDSKLQYSEYCPYGDDDYCGFRLGSSNEDNYYYLDKIIKNILDDEIIIKDSVSEY